MTVIINANTKIAALIRYKPAALEAIVSISPKFTKLRNPILRKVIAGRTSIAMASKIGGVRVEDFYNKLKPLGFEINKAVDVPMQENITPVPDFLKNAGADMIITLDVRPVIQAGKDPLNIILQKVKTLNKGQILKIVNTFEPTPLMYLLGKQGFGSYAEPINDELVQTYFYKKTSESLNLPKKEHFPSGDWNETLQRFDEKTVSIDVRALEMPLPMHAILEALETLPPGKALFVYHKRLPVFLLPELHERQFSYLIREVSDTEVHLLIYKDCHV